MKFQIGDRVVLNDCWVEHSMGPPSKNYPKGREALVIGKSRTLQCIRVAFKGMKTVQVYHESFFDLKAAATHHTIAWAKGHK